MMHTPVWKLFLYCAVKEVSKDLFCSIFTQTDPQVYAIFDHYQKIHSKGHAVKMWECYFKLLLLQSELGGFGTVPSVH